MSIYQGYQLKTNKPKSNRSESLLAIEISGDVEGKNKRGANPYESGDFGLIGPGSSRTRPAVPALARGVPRVGAEPVLDDERALLYPNALRCGAATCDHSFRNSRRTSPRNHNYNDASVPLSRRTISSADLWVGMAHITLSVAVATISHLFVASLERVLHGVSHLMTTCRL